MKEEWREILDGFYEASSLGRIRRRLPGMGAQVGKILSQWPLKNGYLHIVVCINGVKRGFLVHRLVMLAFRGPCPPGKEVNHKDTVKSNCRIDNLEYKTHVKNIRHAIKLGLGTSGERNGCSKLTWKKVNEIKKFRIEANLTQRALGVRFGVTSGTIGRVLRCESWRQA